MHSYQLLLELQIKLRSADGLQKYKGKIFLNTMPANAYKTLLLTVRSTEAVLLDPFVSQIEQVTEHLHHPWQVHCQISNSLHGIWNLSNTVYWDGYRRVMGRKSMSYCKKENLKREGDKNMFINVYCFILESTKYFIQMQCIYANSCLHVRKLRASLKWEITLHHYKILKNSDFFMLRLYLLNHGYNKILWNLN